jgi:hypothetical protein
MKRSLTIKEISTILSLAKEKNPYPKDIFIEPSKEDWALLNSLCRIHGKNSESFMGSFGRLVWDNCIQQIEESINEESVDGQKS